MIKTIDDHMSQFISDPISGTEHRRQHAVCIEGVSTPLLVDMRDIILWVAYRLDTGLEGYVENHLLAATLRSVADTYYSHTGDFAAYLAENYEEEDGSAVVVPSVASPFDPIDEQFLALDDGFAVLGDTFTENLIGDQARNPVLMANSDDTLDFVFPERAVASHRVRGLRISKIDFLNWLWGGRVYYDAYRTVDAVLADYLALRSEEKRAYEQRMKDKYGPDCLDAPPASAPLNAEDADAILGELVGLTT